MEILILGDSLAFGRSKYGIGRDLTWPYLLGKEFGCGLQVRARGGASMVDVAKEAHSLNEYWLGGVESRKFDITFVQAGIVDCCPRLAPRSVYPYVKRMPGFRNLERNPSAHKLWARPWTSKTRFHKALSKLSRTLSSISNLSFFVEIANPVNYLLKNVGDFSYEVSNYNDILVKVAGSQSLVNWQAESSEKIHLLPDGHHLTVLGHQLVAKACLNKYQEVI